MSAKGKSSGAQANMVVMFDFDNTLFDNDLVRTRLEQQLTEMVGAKKSGCFWQVYEDVRRDTDRVDFPESVRRFSRAFPSSGRKLDALLKEFPFADFMYTDSLKVLRHVASFATPIVLSDGDQVFQHHKIRASGVADAVLDNVLIYSHKEHHVEDIQVWFPAFHYVMVDDKPRIQAAMKEALKDRVTTVMVCQGKYANDPGHHDFPGPDVTIERISDLLDFSERELRQAAAGEV